MTLPELETVLSVVNGHTLRPRRSFKWGESIPQFSVGSQGDWIVSAPGVASVHLLLTFDGRRMHAASVQGAPPVYLQGNPIGCSWHALPVPSELSFGQVRISVSCQQVGAQTSSDSKAAVKQRSASPAPLPGPLPRNASAPPIAIADGKGGTQLLDDYKDQLTRRRESHTPSAPPFQAEAAPVRMFGRTQASLQTPSGATGPHAADATPDLNRTLKEPGTPTAAQGPATPAPLETPEPAPAPLPSLNSTVKLTPPEAPRIPDEPARFASPPPTAEVGALLALGPNSPTMNSDLAQPPGTTLPIPPVAAAAVPATLDSPLISAAPDHAALVANAAPPPGLAYAAKPAPPNAAPIPTAAPVQQAAAPLEPSQGLVQSSKPPVDLLTATEMPLSTVSDGGALRDFAAQIPPSPPDPVLLPSPQGAAPAAAQPMLNSAAPLQQAQSAPPRASTALDSGELPIVVPGEVKRVSWVKKLTLALLPIAGFFLWAGDFFASQEPVERATASASVKTPASKGPDPALKQKAMPQAAPSAVPAKPAPHDTKQSAKTTEPAAPAPAPKDVADAEPPPAAASDGIEADDAPAGVVAAPADPATARAVRMALDAAFEGRLADASVRYQQLAKIPDGQIYALAAQHLELGTVRSP